MKTTKIHRCHPDPYDSIFCPYCGWENRPPNEFYDNMDTENFQFIQTCKDSDCRKEYVVTHLDEI